VSPNDFHEFLKPDGDHDVAVNIREDQLDRILEVLDLNGEVIEEYQRLTQELKSKKNDRKYGTAKWTLDEVKQEFARKKAQKESFVNNIELLKEKLKEKLEQGGVTQWLEMIKKAAADKGNYTIVPDNQKPELLTFQIPRIHFEKLSWENKIDLIIEYDLLNAAAMTVNADTAKPGRDKCKKMAIQGRKVNESADTAVKDFVGKMLIKMKGQEQSSITIAERIELMKLVEQKLETMGRG